MEHSNLSSPVESIKSGTQTLEDRLAYDEDDVARIHIETWQDLLRHVIAPFVAIASLYLTLTYIDWRLATHFHVHQFFSNFAVVLYSTFYLTAGGIVISTAKRYDKHVTAPLWYVLQEWVILPGTLVYLTLIFVTSGPSRTGALLGTCTVFCGRVIFSWWKTRQPIPYLVMDTAAILVEVTFFLAEFIFKPLHRAVLVLSVGLRSGAILLLYEFPVWTRTILSPPVLDPFESSNESNNRMPRILAWSEWLSDQPVAPAETPRIIHISDLHLRPIGVGNLEHGEQQDPQQHARLIAAISASSPDLVVVSGDVTDTGSAADYAAAANFFKDLRNAIGDVPIIAAPGNHDLSISPTAWTVTGSSVVRALVNAAGSATRPFYRPFDIRCARFNRFAESLGMPVTASIRGVNLFNLDDHDLSVITLCTPMSNSWIGFNGMGEFSRESMRDIEALKPRLRSRVVVVCHHHARSPEGDSLFYQKSWKALKYAFICAGGSMRFADTLVRALGKDNRNCVVLHGHTHVPRRYHIQAPANPSIRVPVLCAPSALEGPHTGFMLHRWGAELETIQATWDEARSAFLVSVRLS